MCQHRSPFPLAVPASLQPTDLLLHPHNHLRKFHLVNIDVFERQDIIVRHMPTGASVSVRSSDTPTAYLVWRKSNLTESRRNHGFKPRLG